MSTQTQRHSGKVTADNPLAAAHQIRVLTEKGERPSLPAAWTQLDKGSLSKVPPFLPLMPLSIIFQESSMYVSEPCRDFLYTACLRCTATERLAATRKLKEGRSEVGRKGPGFAQGSAVAQSLVSRLKLLVRYETWRLFPSSSRKNIEPQ